MLGDEKYTENIRNEVLPNTSSHIYIDNSRIPSSTNSSINENISSQIQNGTPSSSIPSASIRSSKRRVKKDSSVVLNRDKLKLYVNNDKINSLDSNIKSNNSGQVYPNKSKRVFFRVREFKINRSAKLIQKSWRKYLSFRINKFLQFNRWTERQSQKVFFMIYGYRVRLLFRYNLEIKKNISSQRDITRVIVEMFENYKKSNRTSYDSIELLYKLIWNVKISSQIIESCFFNLDATDKNLLGSLVKQLITEKEQFHNILFKNAKMVHFPFPGYWDFSHLKFSEIFSDPKSSFVSPPRTAKALGPEKILMTPPNLKEAITNTKNRNFVSKLPSINHGEEFKEEFKDSSKKKINNENSSVINTEEVKKIPSPLHELFVSSKLSTSDATSLIKQKISNKSIKSSITGIHGSSLFSNESSTPPNQNLKNQDHPNLNVSSPTSTRKREGDNPSIQLDILSGDKLIPAKKGAPYRDEKGEIVPDRIPCLRVKMLLPNWSISKGNTNQYANIDDNPNSVGLKKVFQSNRDFEDASLNPRWNSTFSISLPCPKSVVLDIVRSFSINSSELSRDEYEKICRSLAKWWSNGKLNIEVYDGERFNEDIFMGKIDLTLNGFMVLIKNIDEFEMKGEFPLEKEKSSQRVSGSIKLHAYLHMPSKEYIENLISDQNQQSEAKSNQVINERQNDSVLNSSDTEKITSQQSNYNSKFMKQLIGSFDKLSNELHSQGILDSYPSNAPNPKLEESENIDFKSFVANSKNNRHLLQENNIKSKPNDILSRPVVDFSEQRRPYTSPGENMTRNSILPSLSNVIKDQAIDSSVMRRHFIEDITKQLDGLTAVQQSTDAILGNFQQKLETKRLKSQRKRRSSNESDSNLDLSNLEESMLNSQDEINAFDVNTIQEGVEETDAPEMAESEAESNEIFNENIEAFDSNPVNDSFGTDLESEYELDTINSEYQISNGKPCKDFLVDHSGHSTDGRKSVEESFGNNTTAAANISVDDDSQSLENSDEIIIIRSSKNRKKAPMKIGSVMGSTSDAINDTKKLHRATLELEEFDL